MSVNNVLGRGQASTHEIHVPHRHHWTMDSLMIAPINESMTGAHSVDGSVCTTPAEHLSSRIALNSVRRLSGPEIHYNVAM